MYYASTCSIEAELTALIYDLGSKLAAERGVSGRCRVINTNQPVAHKATRVEGNHKVTPYTISLKCQKRSWHVVAQIYGDQKKECKCICLCLLLLMFCSFSGIKDFSLCMDSGLWVVKVLQVH